MARSEVTLVSESKDFRATQRVVHRDKSYHDALFDVFFYREQDKGEAERRVYHNAIEFCRTHKFAVVGGEQW